MSKPSTVPPGPSAHRVAASALRSKAARAVAEARRCQPSWAAAPLKRRLAVVRALRRALGDAPSDLTATVDLPWRRSQAETLTAEVLPLLDACRFLERQAPRLLAPQRPHGSRPFWLMGTQAKVCRDALGLVLVIGPSNYPILLAGVQLLQALVAGNAVIVKPGRGGAAAMTVLQDTLHHVGLPEGLLHVLSESVGDAQDAIAAGVDKVVLTGSGATGRQVLRDLAEDATPSVMELSGCDAVVVRHDADIDLAARSIAFGMQLNGGFTCIAPRRLLVAQERAEELRARLMHELESQPAVDIDRDLAARWSQALDQATDAGAQLLIDGRRRRDGIGPALLQDVPPSSLLNLAEFPLPAAQLIPVPGDGAALQHIADWPLRLGASIFGSPGPAADLARRVDVGVVVVNDLIVPTADARLPFGGRGASGFGSTRGAEGLLEMTAVKSVIVRRGKSRPHLQPVDDVDAPMFEAMVQLSHGSSWGRRFRALGRLMAAGKDRSQRQAAARKQTQGKPQPPIGATEP